MKVESLKVWSHKTEGQTLQNLSGFQSHILSTFVGTGCFICLLVFQSSAFMWHFKAFSVGVGIYEQKNTLQKEIEFGFPTVWNINFSIRLCCLLAKLSWSLCILQTKNSKSAQACLKYRLSCLSLQVLPQVFLEVQPELSKKRGKPERHEEVSGKRKYYLCSLFTHFSCVSYDNIA